MLPILRIIPVGGVFLAIMILVLALGAPDTSLSGKRLATLSARGPLQQIDEHPEWRQSLIQAALRRADELNQLRSLPETPADDSAKVAVLPMERNDSEPEDVTGTIKIAPAATIPIEIGESSSTELPAITPETQPTGAKPGQVKSKIDIKRKTARRIRRIKQPIKPPEPTNIFEAIFGVPTTRQAATTVPANQQGAVRTDTSTR